MTEPIIKDAQGIVDLIIASACQVDSGDLIGYSSGWKRADADAATNIYAQFVAMETLYGDGVKTIKACKRCTIYDADAPFTADTAQYTSGTAGAMTETRPATDNDMIQVVGRSVDTYNVVIDIQPPKEFEIFLTPDTLDTTDEPGLGVADAGWPGPGLDAAAEKAYFKGRLPSGLVGAVSAAVVVFNSVNASAFDNDVTVVGGHDGASNVEDTGTAITAGDFVQADTDNILLTQNIAACFDSGFWKPGMNFAVLLDPDAVTGEAQVIGLYIRGFKV